VLQFVAVCCSVLQCVAVCIEQQSKCDVVCCSVLQCVAVCCGELRRVAVCCSVLQCVAVRCSMVGHVAVCDSAYQSVASSCSVPLISYYSALQCTILYAQIYPRRARRCLIFFTIISRQRCSQPLHFDQVYGTYPNLRFAVCYSLSKAFFQFANLKNTLFKKGLLQA